MGHHIFTAEGWKHAQSLSHPTVQLEVSTVKEDFEDFGARYVELAPKLVDVVADSGAQSCLWSRDEFLECGLELKDLVRVNHAMEATNTARIDGALLLRLSFFDSNGRLVQAAVMV